MKHAVVVYGRFQGPHLGHVLVADAAYDYARCVQGEFMIIPTRTVDTDKNIFPFDVKVELLRNAMPLYFDNVRDDMPGALMDILRKLPELGFARVTIFCGSDRCGAFTRILNTYNHIEFKFDSVGVISVGTGRDKTQEGIASYSASKLRELVKNNDIQQAMRIMPNELHTYTNWYIMREYLREQEEVQQQYA